MNDWVAKLGQGLARLSTWRVRGRRSGAGEASETAMADGEASGHGAARAQAFEPRDAAPAVPVATEEIAAEEISAGEIAAEPAIDSGLIAADDALAELGDPLSAPEADALAMPEHTAETTNSQSAHYAAPAGLDDLDVFPESDVIDALPPAEPAPPRLTAPEETAPMLAAAAPRDPSAAEGPATEPRADADADAVPVGRFASLRQAVGSLACLLGRKRVWIPAAGLATVSTIGGLSFMLLQASSEKAGLEADLAAARQALKRADVPSARVAIAPVPIPAPAVSADAPPAPSPQADVPATATPAPAFHIARAPRGRGPVQMNCDLTDKASVSLNLMKCIDAFNEATAR